MEAHNCILCNLRRRRIHYMVSSSVLDANPGIAQYIIEGIAPRQVLFNNEEYICRPCWQRAERATIPDARSSQEPEAGPSQDPDASTSQEPGSELHSTDLFVPEYSRGPNTANSCLFYGCQNTSRHRIAQVLKTTFLIHFNYYVPTCARVCKEHLNANEWDQLFIAPNVSHYFNRAQFVDIISIMKTAALNNPMIDFEHVEDMEPSVLHFRVGLTHNEFYELLQETPSLSQACNDSKTALGMFLMKLRTGETNERLANLFNVSRRTLERKMSMARDCLTQDFVSRNLGFDHMSRDDIVSRNLLILDGIFNSNILEAGDKKAIVICDGTYVYIQKSTNFFFQRLSYSNHKYANLLKPFLIVCCDGHILEVTGPHAATTSDATIMNTLMNENGPAHWVFREGDVFILDRGFRDAIAQIESCGYKAAIPETRNRGEDQLSTIQVNKSRLVTLCRWVVEVVNGRIKRDLKLFRQDYFNSAMTHMFQDFRIAAALINRYHRRIENNVHAEQFLQIINQKMHTPNVLADYVIEKNMNRQRAAFRDVTVGPEDITFPILTIEELTLFALGSYQIKLAYSYYSEHIRQGLYRIQINEEPNSEEMQRFGIDAVNTVLLRGRIQSRHTRSRIYYTYTIMKRNTPGIEAICHYYCSCATGKRTLRCCAHIMCIVWFLGWARHQEYVRLPAAYLDTIIVDE